MNTQPLAVPVFAVEQAIKALKTVNAHVPSPERTLALETLEKILEAGPEAMPQEVYDALYAGLAG